MNAKRTVLIHSTICIYLHLTTKRKVHHTLYPYIKIHIKLKNKNVMQELYHTTYMVLNQVYLKSTT